MPQMQYWVLWRASLLPQDVAKLISYKKINTAHLTAGSQSILLLFENEACIKQVLMSPTNLGYLQLSLKVMQSSKIGDNKVIYEMDSQITTCSNNT